MNILRMCCCACVIQMTSFAAYADDLIQTRVEWVDHCSNEQIAQADHQKFAVGVGAALTAVLAPKLIDAAVDYVAGSIKASAEVESKTTLAVPWLSNFYQVTTTGELSRSSNTGCVVVVYGNYDTEIPHSVPLGATKGLSKTFLRFEAKLVPMSGLKYFRLVPQVLEVNQLSTSRFWSSDRDISIAVSLSALGGAQPFASTTFTFQAVDEGIKIKAPDARLITKASLPLPYPADLGDANLAKAQQAAKAAPYIVAMSVIKESAIPSPAPNVRPNDLDDPVVAEPLKAYCSTLATHNKSKSTNSRVTDERCERELSNAKDALDKAVTKAFVSSRSLAWARQLCPDYVPDSSGSKCTIDHVAGLQNKTFGTFITSASVTETRSASKFGEVVAKAMGAAASDVKTVIKDRLPDAKEKAQTIKDEGDRQARRAVAIADLEVQKQEALLSEVQGKPNPTDSEVLGAQLALAKAKIAANDAYRKAGLMVPYPEYD